LQTDVKTLRSLAIIAASTRRLSVNTSIGGHRLHYDMMRSAMPLQLLWRSPACVLPARKTLPVLRCTSGAPARSTVASSNADELVSWVVRNGGAVDGVAIGREGQQGLGLIATQASGPDFLCTTCRGYAPPVQQLRLTHGVCHRKLTFPQAGNKHDVVVKLPAACQLSYGADSDPALLSLINRVPAELWGARLALQVAAAADVKRPTLSTGS
jgi:hypothetical protein